MTITIYYRQQPAPGYVPRKPVTLHNVESVSDAGVHMLTVRFMFSDFKPVHDHVASVSIKPEQED